MSSNIQDNSNEASSLIESCKERESENKDNKESKKSKKNNIKFKLVVCFDCKINLNTNIITFYN